MRRIVTTSLLGSTAAALLAFAVGQASANQLSLSSRTFRVTWSSLQATPTGFEPIRCPATLEGSFHSATFAKVAGSLVGQVTRASVGACTGGTITVLAETLPWHLQYEGYQGTLPAITGVDLRLVGFAASGSFFGFRCLYRSTQTSPARLTFNLSSGTVTGVRADERAALPLAVEGFFCARTASVSGTGAATVLGSTTRVSVTLIGAAADHPRIVTVGDSFISGEGGRWGGNTALATFEKVDALGRNAYVDEPGTGTEKIALCHRSQSWPGGISILGEPLTLNLACSGAKRATFTETTGEFKPGLDLYNVGGRRGQALMLQEYAAAHPGTVRMVAISIGGNDFGFGPLIVACVTGFYVGYNCKEEAFGTRTIEAGNLAATVTAVTEGIREVHAAMVAAGYPDNSYKLLVANYISPIPPAAQLRETYTYAQRGEVGGCPMREADLDWANGTVLPLLDWAVSQGVATTGLTNIVKLDVSTAINGHRLCERGTNRMEESGFLTWNSTGASDHLEWTNRVITADAPPYYRQESIHPNYWTQKALRKCLRLVYWSAPPAGGTWTCTQERPGVDFELEPFMRIN